jgi:alkaline phosphatase D
MIRRAGWRGIKFNVMITLLHLIFPAKNRRPAPLTPKRSDLSISRRKLFASAGLLSLSTSCAHWSRLTVTPLSMPFTLGIASGEPSPSSVLLWTRIFPNEFDPDTLHPADVEVRWELADDERFSRGLRSGRVRALASEAHTLHVDVENLAPDRWYFYRFHCGAFTSVVGRTRTLPQGQAKHLRFAVSSCQHYETGYFAAHRHLAAEALDLIWFVGDYIYEYRPTGITSRSVRQHDGGICKTLSDYRRRYALYKRDANLQLMHASAPFLPIWDDHEVDNDYAGLTSRDHDPAFAARRAAAYRAYIEHMPIHMPRLAPDGSVGLYRNVDFGNLVRFHALDDRQYRDEQPCSPAGHGAGYKGLNECPERTDPTRSMLGLAQERWFERSVSTSQAGWNIVAQQTLMAQAQLNGRVWVDGWDGYPAARARLLSTLARPGVNNPIVVGGDVHATYISDLRLDPARDDTPIVAREFCGTSISTPSWPQTWSDRVVSENPDVRYARSDRRGYLIFDVTQDHLKVTVRALDNARLEEAQVESLISFEVAAGQTGSVLPA